jgi:hypothetical protein
MGFGPARNELLATRGERLALHRQVLATGDGHHEIEYLALNEVDVVGRLLVATMFDPSDLDAAYEELDRCFDAGEAASYPRVREAMRRVKHAWESRDWDALAAVCAADFAMDDHRLLGFGTEIRDAAAWVRAQQALVALAPDVRVRGDHVRMRARGWLQQVTQHGTREGGAFEMRRLVVWELDDLGKVRRQLPYDLDQLDAALARYEEIGAAAPRDPLAALQTGAPRSRPCG